MNYIEIPSTRTKLFEGTIVASSKYPGTQWILRNGWYSYQGTNCRGWYISSIPSKSNLPVDFEILETLTVISEGCNPGCPPGGHGSSDKAYQLDRAFITVDTEAERDYLLRNKLVPDGKIVKVNQTTEGTKYFKWNQVTQTWEIETFGIDTSNFISSDDFNSRLVESISNDDKVKQSIKEVTTESIQWNKWN